MVNGSKAATHNTVGLEMAVKASVKNTDVHG